MNRMNLTCTASKLSLPSLPLYLSLSPAVLISSKTTQNTEGIRMDLSDTHVTCEKWASDQGVAVWKTYRNAAPLCSSGVPVLPPSQEECRGNQQTKKDRFSKACRGKATLKQPNVQVFVIYGVRSHVKDFYIRVVTKSHYRCWLFSKPCAKLVSSIAVWLLLMQWHHQDIGACSASLGPT